MNCFHVGLFYSTFTDLNKNILQTWNYCQKWQKFDSNYCQNWQYLDKLPLIYKANQIIAKNGKHLSQIIAKNGNIWTSCLLTWIKSNYSQKWQYLDKSSSKMDAKSCQKWQKKNVEQKLPLLAAKHSSIVYLCLAWMVVCFPDSWSQL